MCMKKQEEFFVGRSFMNTNDMKEQEEFLKQSETSVKKSTLELCVYQY